MGVLDVFQKGTRILSPQPAPKFKILVVDDEEDLRSIYDDFLSQEGYTIITAKNGYEGLEMALKHKPNLILLDLVMPGMDGNELLRHLWDNQQTRQIPVIVLTNAGNLKNMENAKFYSAKKFLVKANVSLDEVLHEIRAVLGVNVPNPIMLYGYEPTRLKWQHPILK